MRDFALPTGTDIALADILDSMETMSIENLELGLEMAKSVRQTFLNSNMELPVDTWNDIVHRLEVEILERTLLK